MPKPIGGAYTVTCTVNNRRYAGSSGDVFGRWKHHRYLLRHGKHYRPEMQADWDLYGEDAFIFFLVEAHVEPTEWKLCEQELLDDAFAAGLAYNSAPSAFDNTGTVRSEEHKQAISAANKGVPKTAGHRAKLSEAHLAYWDGREVTQEYRDQMAERARLGKGRPKSEETRRKMSEAQKGRQFTEEHLANLRAARKGVRPTAKLTEDKVREIKWRLKAEESCAALGREFNVSPLTISDIKHGRTWRDVKM